MKIKGVHAPGVAPRRQSVRLRGFAAFLWALACWTLSTVEARPSPVERIGRSLQQKFTAVPEPLKVPWVPLLTDAEMARGMYYGSGSRMRKVALKLLASKPIKVVLLGGSVTDAGAMSLQGLSYASRLFTFINQTFPHPGHVFKNEGIPSSNSGWFAPCIDRMVGKDADLVFVELAVNDMQDAAPYSLERRTYELLLRRVLSQPSQPAVALLHHYGWLRSGGYGLKAGLFFGGAEAMFAQMAQYYDLPSLSFKAAAWRQMQAGIDGFRVDKVVSDGGLSLPSGFIPAAGPQESKSFVYTDQVHPAQAGHQILAELACAPLIRALWEAGSSMVQTQRQDGRLSSLPPPMIPMLGGDGARTAGVCSVQRMFERNLVPGTNSGFTFAAQTPSAPEVASQGWGWVTTSNGSSITLQTDTRSYLPAPFARAQVLLMYLKGPFSVMGAADVSCVQGCACAPVKLDGGWAKPALMMSVLKLSATQHAACQIRVVTTEPGKVLLSGFMINH